MLFQRRQTPNLTSRLQAWLWPRSGWRRALGYVWHRVNRLSGSPHAVAIGFSAGVFASFTPFMGFHFIIGFALAFALGGSLIASAFGTFAGNPVTFPFIWLMTYKFGSFLLGVEEVDQGELQLELPATAWWMLINDPQTLWVEFWNQLWPVIRPMTVGGVPLGILAGIVFYFPVKLAIATYQRRRKERLAERARLQKRTSNEVNA
jgi:hypothetical protein